MTVTFITRSYYKERAQFVCLHVKCLLVFRKRFFIDTAGRCLRLKRYVVNHEQRMHQNNLTLTSYLNLHEK